MTEHTWAVLVRLLTWVGMVAIAWCGVLVVDSYVPGAPRVNLWLGLVPPVLCVVPFLALSVRYYVVSRVNRKASNWGTIYDDLTGPGMRVLRRMSLWSRLLYEVGSIIFIVVAIHGSFSAQSPSRVDGHYFLTSHRVTVEVDEATYRRALAAIERSVAGFAGALLVGAMPYVRYGRSRSTIQS